MRWILGSTVGVEELRVGGYRYVSYVVCFCFGFHFSSNEKESCLGWVGGWVHGVQISFYI